MVRFNIIYDYICPYCYLMFREVRDREEKDARVFWVPVELFPNAVGGPFEKAIGIRQKNKIEKKVSMLAKSKRFLIINLLYYNTHLAMLTDFVSIQTNGERTEVIEELFNRVFVYNENGDWNILYKVCMNLALDFEIQRGCSAASFTKCQCRVEKQYAKRIWEHSLLFN